jgi:hypothetical protein
MLSTIQIWTYAFLRPRWPGKSYSFRLKHFYPSGFGASRRTNSRRLVRIARYHQMVAALGCLEEGLTQVPHLSAAVEG